MEEMKSKEKRGQGLASPTCSASDLLRAEADRMGGILENKPIHRDIRWAYSIAAEWLDSRNDPATVRKWQETPIEQNS